MISIWVDDTEANPELLFPPSSFPPEERCESRRINEDMVDIESYRLEKEGFEKAFFLGGGDRPLGLASRARGKG